MMNPFSLFYLPGSEGSGAVHLDRRLEEERPDQPVGAEQGELVARVASQRLLLTRHLRRQKNWVKIIPEAEKKEFQKSRNHNKRMK